ncbi:MAG: hypothetical protein ACTHMX_12270 [Thermomicrobiales bacterium]
MDSSPDLLPTTSDVATQASTSAANEAATPDTGPSRGMLVAVFVWAAIVLGLLAYLFFGSITARMWKLDSLQQAWVQDNSPRRVAHIWWYQMQHLPEFAGPIAMKLVFGGALAVIVAGSAACIWLMLTDVRRGGSHPE